MSASATLNMSGMSGGHASTVGGGATSSGATLKKTGDRILDDEYLEHT